MWHLLTILILDTLCSSCRSCLHCTLTGQLSSVLSACLRGLYELTAKPRKPKGASAAKDESLLSAGAEAKSLNQLYVLVVCVLMLVQDSAVAAALCRGLQTSVPWYRERPMESVSLL